MIRRLGVALALITAITAPAYATNVGAVHWKLPWQAQLDLLGTLAGPDRGFGGLEAHLAASIIGLGARILDDPK